jgi:hypothetical protein
MKRLFKFLLSFVLVFMLLTPVVSFAVEVTVEGEAIDYNTIFTRVWEFVEENKTECVSGAGSLLLLIVSGAVKIANSKASKKLSEQLNIVQTQAQEDSRVKNNVLSSIINAVNQMISGYNVMKESNDYLKTGYEDMKTAYEINATKEDDRNRLIGAVMVQNTALLEILSSVYVHNKNLPQGVKDLIILKYANAMKALSDDEILCAVVESVREKINFEAPADVTDVAVVETDAESDPDAVEV